MKTTSKQNMLRGRPTTLYPRDSPKGLYFSAKNMPAGKIAKHDYARISFLYDFTKLFMSCLLSFTIIFLPVVNVMTVSGVSSTISIKWALIKIFTPFNFVTSINIFTLLIGSGRSPIFPCTGYAIKGRRGDGALLKMHYNTFSSSLQVC